jgi:hypothetical protein
MTLRSPPCDRARIRRRSRWYSEIGALNRILIIRKSGGAAKTIADRFAALTARNPFGIGEFITELSLDSYVPFDFMPPLRPGAYGPCYEVRSYGLKPDGLSPTIELGARPFRAARACRRCWQRWSRPPARRSASCMSGRIRLMTSARGCAKKLWPMESGRRRADPVI